MVSMSVRYRAQSHISPRLRIRGYTLSLLGAVALSKLSSLDSESLDRFEKVLVHQAQVQIDRLDSYTSGCEGLRQFVKIARLTGDPAARDVKFRFER